MKPEVRPEVSVRALFALVGVAIAAFFPFFPLFLKDRGLDPDEIGLVPGGRGGLGFLPLRIVGRGGGPFLVGLAGGSPPAFSRRAAGVPA